MGKGEDQQFVMFLQWALPRLGLRWPGFRKVRGQVRKRIGRRITELALDNLRDYRLFLDGHPEEWPHLDNLCRITISRFFRDRGVFSAISDTVLPDLAAQVASRGRDLLRCWSCGCASGEEPYSLALIWQMALVGRFPSLSMTIVGTDADPVMLQRAREAHYPAGCLKELPAKWRKQAFLSGPTGHLSLKAEYKKIVSFLNQDVRSTAPMGRFHLIMCRNLAFTYFDLATQEKILGVFAEHLEPSGALVIGCHEKLPPQAETTLAPWGAEKNIFRKTD
jgi:chemotaxis protein methyltransferase CheR